MDVGQGFKTIARFLGHLADKQGLNSVYRGQANEAWDPIPSAFRPGQHGITSQHDLNRWKGVAGRFERASTDVEWLVLAQHYGIATPLLDWTTNALVALLFASQHYREADGAAGLGFRNGAVFMVPTDGLTRETNPNLSVFARWNGAPLLVQAEYMNKRSIAQASVMTLHCEGNHYMTPGFDGRIFVVNAAEKEGVQAALRTLGLSMDRVYDDIGVAAREFSDSLQRIDLDRTPPSSFSL